MFILLKDRVVILCCAAIFIAGFFGHSVFGGSGDIIDNTMRYIALISNVVTVVAFFWALHTYRDWYRVKEDSEYHALIQLSKSAHKVISSLQWYLYVMTTSEYAESTKTGIEKAARFSQIEQAYSAFYKAIDSYDSSRAYSRIYESQKTCSQIYKDMDSLMLLAARVFNEIETEKLKLTFIHGLAVDGMVPISEAFEVPANLSQDLEQLGFTNKVVATSEFFEACFEKVKELTTKQMSYIEV